MSDMTEIKNKLSELNLELSYIIKHGKNVFTVSMPGTTKMWKLSTLSELQAFEDGFRFALSEMAT